MFVHIRSNFEQYHAIISQVGEQCDSVLKSDHKPVKTYIQYFSCLYTYTYTYQSEHNTFKPAV